MMTTRDALLTLERAGWNSLCDGTGDTFYPRVMTEDARMVLANGMVMDRRMVAESLADAPSWDDYEISDPQVMSLGDDVRALIYTGGGRREAGDDFVGIMTSVYVRHGDDWKLALYQQTQKV